MAITITEDPNIEQFKSNWGKMVGAIEPDIRRLPDPWKETFQGIIDIMMSSTMSLGIIPKKRMYAIYELHSWILNINKYPDFVNYDLTWIASLVAELFGGLIEMSMAEEGRFLLEGPMSRQFMYSQQRTSTHTEPMARSRFSGYRGE